jgi:hypothetical protein
MALVIGPMITWTWRASRRATACLRHLGVLLVILGDQLDPPTLDPALLVAHLDRQDGAVATANSEVGDTPRETTEEADAQRFGRRAGNHAGGECDQDCDPQQPGGRDADHRNRYREQHANLREQVVQPGSRGRARSPHGRVYARTLVMTERLLSLPPTAHGCQRRRSFSRVSRGKAKKASKSSSQWPSSD